MHYLKPAWSAFYDHRAWRHKPTGLRWQTLLRDLFTCQECGWQARPSETHKLHADHINPHKGDWERFIDPTNTRTLCENCHNSLKQQEEKLGYSPVIGADGYPIDDRHPANGGKPAVKPSWQGPMSHPVWFRPVSVPLAIVCGPPASGKSTYVASHMGPGDQLIELDAIARQAFGKPVRLLPDKTRVDCLRIRNDMLGKYMRKVSSPPPMLWLIVSEPIAAARQWWADTVKPQQIIVIATPEAECLKRAERDPDKTKRQGTNTAHSITKWWADYTPRPQDTVLTP